MSYSSWVVLYIHTVCMSGTFSQPAESRLAFGLTLGLLVPLLPEYFLGFSDKCSLVSLGLKCVCLVQSICQVLKYVGNF